MKKLSLLLCASLVALPGIAGAEPISFEQAANVTGLAGIEVGADFDYSYAKFTQEGVTLNEQTATDIPVFVRAGLPILEAKLTVPYGNVKNNVTAAQEQNYSGIRNVGLMVKTGLLTLPMFSLGLGLDTSFPTGDPKKYLGEGLDLNPFLAAGVDLSLIKLNANLGFQYRGEFTVSSDVDANGVTIRPAYKVKPGDAFKYAVGVEIPAGPVFSLLAELQGAGYSEAKQTPDGGSAIAVPNSVGSTMTLVPGIRAHAGPVKAKLGVEIPITKSEAFRLSQNASTADWRVIGGLSLQFSL